MNSNSTSPILPRVQIERSRAHRWRLWLGIVVSLLYLIVRTHAPISIHAESIHDDQLFMSMGQKIAIGHWLGGYNQLTLIKGPGYPLFLALNAWLGTSLALSEAILLGLSIGAFFWAFHRISRMPNVALFGFAATLWMPAPYLERIMRDCIYPAQLLLVLAGLIACLYIDMSRKRRYALGLLTGLALGWFSLTREEGIWVLPGVAILAAAALIHHRLKQPIKKFVLAPLALVVIGYGITQATYLSLNKIAYGSFVGVEITSSPFKDAIATLQSVQAGPQIPYVPVSRAAREAVYAVSPAFSKLKPYLDPITGSPWQFGCHFYAETCGDIAGGWFMWAVRDAVAVNGYYTSPKASAAFYRELTDEVKAACRAGTLKCKPLLVSQVPRISAVQWQKLPGSLLDGLRQATLYQPSLANIPSSGPPADLMADVEFLGSPPRTTSDHDNSIYSINGWYYGKDRKGWITGKTASNDDVSASKIERGASPDLVSGLGDASAGQQRFSTTVACQEPCIFSFVDDTGATIDLKLANEVGHAASYPLNGATLNIDRISQSSANFLASDPRYRFAAAWRRITEKAYGHVLPWLLMLSFVAMLAGLLISFLRRALSPVMAVTVTVWALLVSRLVLLALVDISSFPAMIVPYLSPVFVLACIGSILPFAALYELMADTPRRQGQPIEVAPPSTLGHI